MTKTANVLCQVGGGFEPVQRVPKGFCQMTLKAVVQNMWLSIVLAPIAMFFIIFACLVAGPSEVFKALTNRK